MLKENVKNVNEYNINEKLYIKTSDYINKGIDLEKIKTGDYFIFLKYKILTDKNFSGKISNIIYINNIQKYMMLNFPI